MHLTFSEFLGIIGALVSIGGITVTIVDWLLKKQKKHTGGSLA